ncbi:MAG: Vps62-related protein [Candidatus Aenigmarchaeota archaeon]|nr:Vps62-related protein [Candidatus Aenigmarchaeota archaeon]
MKRLLLLLALFLLFVPSAISPEIMDEADLAREFSPILYFSPQENFFPVSTNYFIQSSELIQLSLPEPKLMDPNPTIEIISNITDPSYYLDHRLNGSQMISADYKAQKPGHTVYYSIKKDSGKTVIQYWFFYAYNKGKSNEHEGDLEFIQIILNSDQQPVFSAYSQHLLGESLEWNGLDKEGTHPKVYVAEGSHANYFKPYQGNLGLESDVVRDDGLVLRQSGYDLVNIDAADQKWINFGGRWGDSSKTSFTERGEQGAPGPGHMERAEPWNSPISWSNKALSINGLWLFGNWIIENFYYIFALIILSAVLSRAYRLKKRGIDITPLKKLLKRKHAFGLVVVVIGIVIALVALLSPLYVVSLSVESGEYATGGVVDIIRVDGIGGAKINTLQSSKGEFPLFGLGTPITLLVITGVILAIVDIIFLTHPRKLAKKYMIGSIYPLLPLILIVLFIYFLSGVIPSFSNFASGQQFSPELSNIVGKISESPLMGQHSFEAPYLGKASLFWGVGVGTYLFILAAILKIAGGLIFLTYKEKTKLFKVPR